MKDAKIKGVLMKGAPIQGVPTEGITIRGAVQSRVGRVDTDVPVEEVRMKWRHINVPIKRVSMKCV